MKLSLSYVYYLTSSYVVTQAFLCKGYGLGQQMLQKGTRIVIPKEWSKGSFKIVGFVLKPQLEKGGNQEAGKELQSLLDNVMNDEECQ